MCSTVDEATNQLTTTATSASPNDSFLAPSCTASLPPPSPGSPYIQLSDSPEPRGSGTGRPQASLPGRVVLAVKDYHARRGRGWARPPYKGVRPHALFSGFGTVPVPSPRLWTNRKNPAARSAVVQRDPLKLYEISAVPLAREPTHNSTYTRLRCSPMSAPRALGQQ